MSNLYKRAFFGVVGLTLVMGLIIFLSAGTLLFWEGWFYLFVFAVCVTIITVYFLQKDPALVERRVNGGPTAEKEKSQIIIQSFGGLFFIVLLVIPGIDQRFNWSQVPPVLVIVANILVLVGFMIVFWVFNENSYTASTIAVEEALTVVTTGPYRWVRHPMYFGAVLMLILTPLAMGSYWGLFCSIPLCIVIVVRLLDEERFLTQNLAGYKDYCLHTKYRLIPLIW